MRLNSHKAKTTPHLTIALHGKVESYAGGKTPSSYDKANVSPLAKPEPPASPARAAGWGLETTRGEGRLPESQTDTLTESHSMGCLAFRSLHKWVLSSDSNLTFQIKRPREAFPDTPT